MACFNFKNYFCLFEDNENEASRGSGKSFTKQLDAARVVLCDCALFFVFFFLLNIFSENKHLLGMLANKKNAQGIPWWPSG